MPPINLIIALLKLFCNKVFNEPTKMPILREPITPYQKVYKSVKIPVINTKNATPEINLIIALLKLDISFLLIFFRLPSVTFIPPNPISTPSPPFSLTFMPSSPIVTSSSPSLTCIPSRPIFTCSFFLLPDIFSYLFSTLIVTSFPSLSILISTFSSPSLITTFSGISKDCLASSCADVSSLSIDASESSFPFSSFLLLLTVVCASISTLKIPTLSAIFFNSFSPKFTV